MTTPQQSLGLDCPRGGDFYICDKANLRFIGCCTSDPCADNSGECPKDDLRYSSFKADIYNQIEEQECQLNGTKPSDASWYTCANEGREQPPFMGCCSNNPCSTGNCPQKNLTAARLSGNPDKAKVFITGLDSSAGSSAGITPGAIAGICIGGIALIVLGLIAWLMVRRRNNRSARDEQQRKAADEASNLYSPYTGSGPYSSGFPSPYQDQQSSGVGSPGAQFLNFSPSQFGSESGWRAPDGTHVSPSHLSAAGSTYDAATNPDILKFLTPEAAAAAAAGGYHHSHHQRQQSELEGLDTEVRPNPVELPLSVPAPAELPTAPQK